LTTRRAARTINELVNNQKQTNAVFAALADPTRRRILARLSGQGERPVTELAKPFRISAPAISRHLRVLERARLIQRRRQGRVHFIRARREGVQPAQQWIAQWIAGWQFSFDRLEGLLGKEKDDER
jgi:DNA-binding transcriptional ArsR family regulator